MCSSGGRAGDRAPGGVRLEHESSEWDLRNDREVFLRFQGTAVDADVQAKAQLRAKTCRYRTLVMKGLTYQFAHFCDGPRETMHDPRPPPPQPPIRILPFDGSKALFPPGFAKRLDEIPMRVRMPRV